MCFNDLFKLDCFQGNKKLIEVFKILTEKELVEKQKKNLKKLKRKLADKVEGTLNHSEIAN